MPEWTFTIFEGADAGMQFILSDRPLALGREPGRDVLLHDERVSRLHLRLTPGPEPLLNDENSSNGTFLNGELVRQARLKAGDVIAVGGTKIIFGASAPLLAQMEEMRQIRERVRLPGNTTEFLAEPESALQSVRATALLTELASAIRPDCQRISVRVHVQPSPAVEGVQLDARRLHASLCALMGEFVGMLRTRPDCVEKDALLALRSGLDPARGGIVLEIICIDIEIPQHDVRRAAEQGAFRAAQEAVAEHAGTMELLPAEDEDILLRVRLPLAASPDAPTVMRNPG